MLEETLLGAVVARTCESSEVDQEGGFGGFGWKIEVEGHLAGGGGALVGELQELAPERGDGRFSVN